MNRNIDNYPIMAKALVLLLMFSAAVFSLSAEAGRIAPGDIPRGDFSIQAGVPPNEGIIRALAPLSDADRRLFLESGELIYRHDGDYSPVILPKSPDMSTDEYHQLVQEISAEHAANVNNFALEVLMLMDLPADLKGNLSGDDLDLFLYNVLHRVSTLAGLEYFSASRGRMREFYLTSSIVEGNEEKPVPDPVFSSIRPEYRFTMRQEDASFGDNLYDVVTRPGSITIKNISPMTYHFLRIAGPGDLELQIRIVRSGDQLLFYGSTSLKAPKIFGIRDKLSNSFYNRIVALYNWYYRELSLTDF